MLISHSHKFIFVKTKKTAGSTIESIIVDNCFNYQTDICTGSDIDGTPRVNYDGQKKVSGEARGGHKAWHHIQNYVTPVEWSNYYKFTVERNPWDKVVSEFYWRLANSPDVFNYDNDKDNFKFYLNHKLGEKGYRAPVDWNLYAKDNKVVVDEVIEYSALADQLCNMFNDKLGIDLSKDTVLNTRKKSGYRKLHYTELYTSQSLIDIVSSLYSREIKHFSYIFGE